MALDSLVKRFFPLVVGALLAAVAYFQASGVVQLLAAKFLDVDGQSLIAASMRPKSPAPVQSSDRASAQPIIDNNLFDWQVDLDPPPPPPPDAGSEEEVAKPELDLSNPLEAPRCDDVSVRIVTESPDPVWSVAVLQGPGEDKPSSRRVGDILGGYQVTYIGFNHIHASPAVWLTKDIKLCQALLFAPALPEKPAQAATTAAPAPEPPKKGAGALPPEIADKITKVSENEFNVERAVVDHILENQGEFMKSARVVPEKTADGKVAGIRLFGVRPDTLLGTLGMKNGDRLETINGFNMGNPEEALNAYARLRTANKLTIKVTRRGQPTSIDFNIK